MTFSDAPLPLAPIIMKMQLRFDICMAALGYGQMRRMVGRVLCVEGDGWSERSLAAYLGRSRSALHLVLAQMAETGVINIDERGLVVLTDKGRSELALLHTETLKIVVGEQVGYSKQLLALAESKPGIKPTKRAETISFPADIPFSIRF